jgi:ZIP family zinc transporter
MRSKGTSRGTILRLWVAVALVCTVASVVGWAIASSVGGEARAAIDGFAAGALLVMLIDSMIPDARRDAGRGAGLVTTLGFAVALALSSVS